MAGILLLPLWVCAQGVNFRPLSYTEAIELAAKENKMVFIDFYTTWCGLSLERCLKSVLVNFTLMR